MNTLSYCVLVLLVPTSVLLGNSFFVSSDVPTGGDGSMLKPWQLQYALNHPAELLPGDTVWLRGGVYSSAFDSQTSYSCFTNGTEQAPIVFRNYNNERATIDGQLPYSMYCALDKCSNTWFWGIEVTNSKLNDRNQYANGGITCTAENMRFINMIVHDLGNGFDSWKTAKNCELYGNVIYHIGNNSNNNGNWEGHGHGMYLQNDTVGTKRIHNNIVFSTYGYGIKIWQTTTTSALGNFDVRRNIVFNGGAASDNQGGVGNNTRTHNFFVVANGVNNPVLNTTIKHDYTYSGVNTPRPPVNAFGLNYGVKNFVLDSNVLVCQTRLGFNNTPVFDGAVRGNKIIGGIPSVYGVYLWGFAQTDFPQNEFVPVLPTSGLDVYAAPNKYNPEQTNLAVYNWEGAEIVMIDASECGLKPNDFYEIVNAMDFYGDVKSGTVGPDARIAIQMNGHTLAQAFGSPKMPVSQFPHFGAFVVRKSKSGGTSSVAQGSHVTGEVSLKPNPTSDHFELTCPSTLLSVRVADVYGRLMHAPEVSAGEFSTTVSLAEHPSGVYYVQVQCVGNVQQSIKVVKAN